MKVWRVENEYGIGPYQTRNPRPFILLDEMTIDHTGYPHEGIASDWSMAVFPITKETPTKPIYFSPDVHVCGFESKSDALIWFGDWIKFLEKDGFLLKEFETDEIIYTRSRRQIAFKKK